ncbi:MAG: IS3 family transposase [Gammaproteobacteria bacterium]
MRYTAIRRYRTQYSVRMMCRAMEVSRSGYYEWVSRPESARAQHHRALTEKIRSFHQASRDTYGAPRIREDLLESGERVGENTVALLMQRAGIVPKTVRKFRVTTDSRKTVPAPNLLEQQFTVAQPNERWVSDITFIPTREGWLYLAVIIDLYSRAVIGWAMHKRMKTELVTDALKMALMRRKVRTPLLLHSDQGSQYAAADYRAMLARHGIECSMSRKGNCWDNAVAESFFHTLKTELVHHEDYLSRTEAKASIFEYIEVFYNRQRRHSHLGQMAPLAFEKAAVSR